MLSKDKDAVLLGRGSFSEVYRVTDQEHSRMLACKVLRQDRPGECAAGLLREAEFLEIAKHPLFPAYMGLVNCNWGKRVGKTRDRVGILMEYVPGYSLTELLQRRGTLTWWRAAEIIFALAEGLMYLHESPGVVIFRDLKPENIMIQQDGRVRLIDLGCACFLENAEQTRAGTRGYAAPEQLEVCGRIGVESDVYALGKLLGYMLTGERKTFTQEKYVKEKYVREKYAKEKNRCIGKYQKCFGRKRKPPAGLLRLAEEMTDSRQYWRIPDMHILLKRLRPYTEKDRKTVKGRWRRGTAGRREGDFYYARNVKCGK